MYFWENAVMGKTEQITEYHLNDEKEQEKNTLCNLILSYSKWNISIFYF